MANFDDLYERMEDSANRATDAAANFNAVLTEDDETDVMVDGRPVPSMSKRIKLRLDEGMVAVDEAVAEAKTEADRAKTEADRAESVAVAVDDAVAEAKTEADRAKTEADRAESAGWRLGTFDATEPLRGITETGTYIRSGEGLPPDAPSSFPADQTPVLDVVRNYGLSGGFYATQELYVSGVPGRRWVRRTTSGSENPGPWADPFDMTVPSSPDPVNVKTLALPGNYVLTEGKATNLPTGWPGGTALVNVEKHGGLRLRTVRPSSNPSRFWMAVESGGWEVAKGFGLSASANFNRDFQYRGLTSNGDVNSLVDEGRYILTRPAANLPPDAPNETAFVTVGVFGAFIFQTLFFRSAPRYEWRRSGQTVSGETQWRDFERIGGGGSTGGTDPLSEKVIAVIGDSIVEGGDWPERIADATGATVHKFGFGGCRMSAYPTSVGRYDGMCGYAIATCIGSGDFTYLLDCAEAVAQPPTNDDNRPQAAALAALDWGTVDILVVAFGTNDWTRPDLSLGEGFAPDPTGATLRGSVAHMVTEIQTTHPNIRVVFQLPSYRTFGGGEGADQDAWVSRPNGIALPDVSGAIAEVASRFGCPVLDFLRDGTVNAFTADHYLLDGIHPRPGVGFDLWAKRIAGWLRTLV